MTRPRARKLVVKKAAREKKADMLATETVDAPAKQPVKEMPKAEQSIISADDMKERLRARGPQTEAERIADSRRVLEFPLAPGQKFFETYDGEIIIGEADKEQVWCDRLNNGKGAWVLPRR
jgi:hypothetical protein